MGKDKRLWRKLVKKLRRKRKRQIQAQEENFSQLDSGSKSEERGNENPTICSDEEASDGVVVVDGEFFLSSDEWEYREKQAELAATVTRIETERLAHIAAENQRKIREEWEAKQECERKLKEEREHLEKQMKEKQEAELNELLNFLSGDIETPPTKYLLPDTILDEENICYYFNKTAACRFYERCTKSHPRPTLSTAILIPNFFSHFKLEQATRDEYDSDLGLEYEDQELHQEFIEFYDDVVPELRKCGTLIQFKVCCNLEPHLRGNVYVQYRTIQEAVEAYRKFNGRFYNGRQLSLQFIKMDSWRSAICGAFLRKACVKGRTCSFLHVFRNPTKEFVKADHDWKETQTQRGPPSSLLAQNAPPTTHQELNSSFPDNLEDMNLPSSSANRDKHEHQYRTGKCTNELNQSSESLVGETNSDQTISTESVIQTPTSHRTKRSRSTSSFSKKRKKAKKEKKLKKDKSKHKKKKKKRKHRKSERTKRTATE